MTCDRQYAISVVVAMIIVTMMVPRISMAFPFGGMIKQIIFCYNNAIYTAVGPPNGGAYIWAPSTKTYQFGPPAHTGQWLLGLAAPPYYCLVSVSPIIVWAGTLMTMEGSSGPAAPGLPGGGLGNFSGGGTGAGGGSPSTSGGVGSGIGHLIVSEIYTRADSSHGGTVAHQWIEIYNPTSSAVDLSRWTVQTSATSLLIPANTQVAANSYVVFSADATVRAIWSIPQAIPVVLFPNGFAGFSTNGDHVYLINSSGTRVDMVSYGTDTTAFSPAVPATTVGRSILRKNLINDTDSSADWVETSAPNPGR